MNKKAIAELYKDLPELVNNNVLSSEAAENIKKHYGPIEETQGTRTLLLVFGVFGALLVGLGIILLIAHNWDQFTRLSRLALSVGLLITAQLAAGLTLWFKGESRIWREAAAALHMLVIGAALALVGQTYHLTGDTDMFILMWMLLSFPLMYLMRASSVAVMFIAGTTFWCVNTYSQPERQFIWVLLSLALPFYWRQMQQDRYANSTAIMSWIGNICLYICFAAAFSNSITKLAPLIYSALFSINYMVGIRWFNTGRESLRMPFKLIGLVGSTVCIFILTFHDFWRHLKNTAAVSTAEYVLVILLLLLVVIGNVGIAKHTGRKNLPFSIAPLIIGSGFLLQSLDTSGIVPTILLNAYMLLLSIWIISTGTNIRSVSLVNIGMLMLSMLIVSRFLDISVSFVIRGLVFVGLGIAFLTVNWLLVRRKPEGHNEK